MGWVSNSSANPTEYAMANCGWSVRRMNEHNISSQEAVFNSPRRRRAATMITMIARKTIAPISMESCSDIINSFCGLQSLSDSLEWLEDHQPQNKSGDYVADH